MVDYRVDTSGETQKRRRTDFKDDEAKLPWLPMLLDAYAVIDEGVAVAVRAEEDDLKIKLACREGCDNCCRTQRDIPVYPLELVGIYWFATEKVGSPRRGTLKLQLEGRREGDPCPFLIEGSCVIHPLRPVGCRQFNVFHEPCDEGEDPYYTRRDDVLTPIRAYTDRAFSAMLPFYRVLDGPDVQEVEEIIRNRAVNLLSLEWRALLKVMEDFDSRA